MGRTSSGSKENPNKNASKITDVKLHNAVLETLCDLSQQVREVRGAIFVCWMIKQEAPEYKRPKEQLRACSEQAATTRARSVHGERGRVVDYDAEVKKKVLSCFEPSAPADLNRESAARNDLRDTLRILKRGPKKKVVSRVECTS